MNDGLSLPLFSDDDDHQRFVDWCGRISRIVFLNFSIYVCVALLKQKKTRKQKQIACRNSPLLLTSFFPAKQFLLTNDSQHFLW